MRGCASVGVKGFEPPAPCSPSTCATRLRYTPESSASFVLTPQATLVMIHGNERFVKWFFNIFFKAVFSPHLAHTMHQHEEVKAHG